MSKSEIARAWAKARGIPVIEIQMPMYCAECGERMFIEENAVSHHGFVGDINHDADADHVARRENDVVDQWGHVQPVEEVEKLNAVGRTNRFPGVHFIGKFVNVYLVDREYGGPEEGGWYYDSGRLHSSTQVVDDDAAEAKKAELQLMCDQLNEGRPPIHSVASYGQYRVYIEEEPGENFPKVRPHYE